MSLIQTFPSGKGGSSVTVDDELSSISENPVQNKAIKAGLDGKADLVDGKIPANQLPSYVDQINEGYLYNGEFYEDSQHTQQYEHETDKIYIDVVSNNAYRWGGSAYAPISEGLALGETESTAYRGDRGKTAYDHSQATGNPHGTTKSDIGLGNVANTADSATPISSGTTKFTTGGAYTELQKRDKSIPFYCTCATTQGTTQKTVTSAETSLVTSLTAGMKISVKFTYNNIASVPTLKLNSLTAKNIKIIDASGTVTTPTKWWGAGDIVDFVYDGTQWLMQPTMSMVGDEYTAGDGIDITNKVVSADAMPAADMSEIVTPLPGCTPKWHTYSTEEQAIGTWIDGKTIYEKTISGISSATAGTWSSTDIGSPVDVVVNAFGLLRNTTNAWILISHSDSDNLTPSAVSMKFTSNSHASSPNKCAVKTGTTTALLSCPYFVTVQYTKV